MTDLQTAASHLRGKLNVLQEQYASALYAAEVGGSPSDMQGLKDVENRINAVNAGIFRLSNSTSKTLKELEIETAGTEAKATLLNAAIADETPVSAARSRALADQMDAELQETTAAFFYNVIAILLVGFMAAKLKAPTA